MTIKNVKVGALVICLIFAVGLNALAIWQYVSYTEIEKELSVEKDSLYKLKEDIEKTKDEIDLYEREKEEFAEYLFDERDVPAFLDEISKLAKKDDVNIVDMKSQRFLRVDVASRIAQTRTDQPIRNRNQTEGDMTAAQRKEIEIKNILTLASMSTLVQVKGTFNALVRFLRDLHNYEQLVSIIDIEISNLREYPQLNCRFTIKIYSLTSLEELKNKK
jgi:hypothetical protein